MNPVVCRISMPKSTCIERRVGEGVTAVVVPTGRFALTQTDVLAPLEGRLARFRQPKRVLFVDELPRSAMGKVQKNLLRDRFAGLCD
ncbi:AMP-binding enzyme [Paracoccus denitrificans]|jgi:malonyl-CoA/methylmalonyl-CoA synthetase|uniref:AMP-binding enzyme n=1 Tax=Paracoccus denitrificans TaxID=266 RepID=UPI0039BF58EC